MNTQVHFADAAPTKQLFLSMLTRDLSFTRAILDLIDNSIDGAMRCQSKGDNREFHVNLTINGTSFEMKDNCGGIPLEIAEKYAFRFGRPEERSAERHSIGQFGVGMKRAFFKIGKEFELESRVSDMTFTVKCKVDEWSQPNTPWHFPIDLINLDHREPNDTGTTIKIRDLHENARIHISDEANIDYLRDQIRAAHQQALASGIVITVNQVPADIVLPKLVRGQGIEPINKTMHIDGGEVTMRIIAGLSESQPDQAGWYVYCNGRMLLEADTSPVTGWGNKQKISIPKFHNQFAMFRGFLFFDSENPGRLPWNTTKTGVDVDSPVYIFAYQEILNATRPFIDILNKMDSEIGQEEAPVTAMYHESVLTDIASVPTNETVDYQSRLSERAATPTPKKTNRIIFEKPVAKVEKARKILKRLGRNPDVKPGEIGSFAFDYFVSNEG